MSKLAVLAAALFSTASLSTTALADAPTCLLTVADTKGALFGVYDIHSPFSVTDEAECYAQAQSWLGKSYACVHFGHPGTCVGRKVSFRYREGNLEVKGTLRYK